MRLWSPLRDSLQSFSSSASVAFSYTCPAKKGTREDRSHPNKNEGEKTETPLSQRTGSERGERTAVGREKKLHFFPRNKLMPEIQMRDKFSIVECPRPT